MGSSPWGRPESDTPWQTSSNHLLHPAVLLVCRTLAPVWRLFSICLTLLRYLSPPTRIRSPGEEGLGLVHDFTLTGLWRIVGTGCKD